MKALFEKIKENEFYKKWFKDALPYVTGAVLLSLFQIVTFATTGNPWGIAGILTNWGAWLYELVADQSIPGIISVRRAHRLRCRLGFCTMPERGEILVY